jgi:Tfp pilus assembly protein PilX
MVSSLAVASRWKSACPAKLKAQALLLLISVGLEISMARSAELSTRITEMRGDQATALNEEDAAVVRRLLETAMVAEPKQRCTANGIVQNWDHMAADNKS